MPFSEFSVDYTKFPIVIPPIPEVVERRYLKDPRVITDPDLTSQEIYDRKETPRFFYIDTAKAWMQAYQERGERRKTFFYVLAKIIAVVTTIISVLMPLAVCYLPAWAPWGIGVPAIIILSLAGAQLQGRVDAYTRDTEFVPHLQEFLKHHSLKWLHPIGEWVLAKLDERLKSDLMMKKELEKRHPKSGGEVELVLKYYDIEITPYAQQQVAASFAHITEDKKKWKAVKKKATESVFHYRMKDFDKFTETMKKGRATAYGKGLHECDFPFPSPEAEIKALVGMYARFCQIQKGTAALLKEGEALYGVCAFLDPSGRTYADWEEHLKFARAVEEKVVPLIKLLEEGNPELLEEGNPNADKIISLTPSAIRPRNPLDVISKLREAKEENLEAAIYQLIDQTNQIKDILKKWVAKHPTKQLERIDKTLSDLEKKDVLSEAALKKLHEWANKHPKLWEKDCIELFEEQGFPEEVKEWLKTHEELRSKTLVDVFNRALYINKKLKKARAEFEKIKQESGKINASAKDYTDYIATLEKFNKDTLAPLNLLIAQDGETSRLKRVAQTFFGRIPSIPFAKKQVSKNPVLRARNIEEIRLNALLRQSDKKMLLTNRVRVGALRVPLYLLMAIEGIFAIYFSTHWFFWGCCVLTAMGEGISHYVDYRLKIMDREKQSLKLQHLLLNRPDVTVTPGTRPRLKKLKEVQETYGLEGVRSTWARMLMEEQDSFRNTDKDKEADESKRSAKVKAEIKKAAQLKADDTQQAAKYLEDRLITLYSQKKEARTGSREHRAISKKILQIETALKPTPKDTKKVFPVEERSTYEKLVIQRNKVDAAFDKVVEERMGLEKKRADYARQFKKFDSLEKEIEILKKEQPTLRELIASYTSEGENVGFVIQALKGDHERDPNKKIDVIMNRIVPILGAYIEAEESAPGEKIKAFFGMSDLVQKFKERLEGPLNELKLVPKDDLFAYQLELKKRLNKLPNLTFLLKKLQKDSAYLSKENIQKELKKIDNRLSELKVKHDEYKEQCKKLKEEIENARPAPKSSAPTVKNVAVGAPALPSQANRVVKPKGFWKKVQEMEKAFTEAKTAEEKAAIWQKEGDNFVNRYLRLNSYNQKKIFYFMPRYTKKYFEENTGGSLHSACVRAYRSKILAAYPKLDQEKERTEAFSKWWVRKEALVVAAFNKIDPRFREHFLTHIPAPFQEKLQKI